MKRTPSPSIIRLAIVPALPFVFVAFGLGAQSLAPPPSTIQSSPTPSTAQNPSPQNPPAQVQATQLAAELTKSINTKKAKTGDVVEAKTILDASLPNGTKIPKGTKLVGNVVEVTAKSKEQKKSHLVFSLNRAVTKDGQDMPIHAAVTSVSAPVMSQSADASMQSDGTSPGMRSASSASGAGGSQMSTTSPASNAPTMAASSSNDQPQQVAVLKSAQDRVPVAGLPNVMLSAPTTPQSAGVLDAEDENFSLESGTKFMVNITPAQAGL